MMGVAVSPPPPPLSSLEIVLEALDRQGDAVGCGAQSFVLSPLWIEDAERQCVTDASLRKLEVSSRELDSMVRAEKDVLAEISSSSSKDRVLEVLKDHLKNLRAEHPRRTGEFSDLVNQQFVEDQELRELLKEKWAGTSRRLVDTVLRYCLKVGFWDPVAALLECGSVSSNENPEIVDRIVEDGNVALVLLCVLHVRDIRPSQWLEIVKLFLSSSKKLHQSFQFQRRVWRQLVSDRLQKVRRRGNAIAANCRDLAIAYDNFTSAELGLHPLLAAEHDEAVVSAIVSELDTSEVSALLRYLNKWLELYSSKTIGVLRMRNVGEGKLVPSLETIICWLSAILESRYATLVMAHDLNEELRKAAAAVSSLVSVTGRMRSMEGLVQHLRSRAPLPSDKPGGHSSEHIIDYLEIS